MDARTFRREGCHPGREKGRQRVRTLASSGLFADLERLLLNWGFRGRGGASLPREQAMNGRLRSSRRVWARLVGLRSVWCVRRGRRAWRYPQGMARTSYGPDKDGSFCFVLVQSSLGDTGYLRCSQ